MKILHLLRHAKSDWSDPSLADHDRPLNGRGRKARLVMAGIEFRYSHDLLYIHGLVLTVEPSWVFLHESLKKLSTYAVAARYPGIDATAEQAERAVEHCRVVRTTIRPALIVEDTP